VQDMVVNPDGSVVCIGDFTTYRGSPAPKIAKLLPNGAMDASFTPGSGVSNAPICLLRYPDGRLLVGGAIPMYDGNIVNGLLVLNADGTIDPASDTSEGFRINNGEYPGGGTVYEMELQPNGQVVCMGEFHMYNGNGRNRICRIGIPNPPMLFARALLEGPYDGEGGMNAALGLAHIPLQEPYKALGFEQHGSGSETISPALLVQQGPQAIVDWVHVELRHPDDPSSIVATRSALLKADGYIVDADGQSMLRFWGTPQGAYYIAIRHRNHFGAMTGTPIYLGFSPFQLDFAQSFTPIFGTDARKHVGDDMLLWAGDVNGDGELKYVGQGNDRDPILQAIGGNVPTNSVAGYRVEDVNLDGLVKYVGNGNDRDPILQNIGGSVPTNSRQAQLP
ncbi:MAG: delta-60 repeat domain-containing protein, partial [Flavobacteriales bacterium]